MRTGAWSTGLAIAATTLSNLPIWIFTGLAPSISEALGFDDLGLGVAAAIFFTVSGLSAIPAGAVVERLGWRRGMIVAAVLSVVSLTGMGLAPRFTILVAFLALGAVGFAFTHPSTGLALAQTVRRDRQGTAFGLKQAALPLTTLLVGVSVPLFLGEDGWRWAFGWSALLTFVFLLIMFPGRRRTARSTTPVSLRRRPMPSIPARRHRPRPPLIMLALGGGLGSTATASIGGFLVVFGVSTGLSPTQAGQLLAIGSGVCLISRLVSGWMADKRGRGHLRVVALMMLGGSLGFGLLAAAVARPWLVVVGTMLAFGAGWAWNGLFAFAVVHNHRENPASATGVVQSAMGIGSALGPAAFGVTVSLLSYTGAWAAAAVTLALGALFMVQGRRLLARAAGN